MFLKKLSQKLKMFDLRKVGVQFVLTFIVKIKNGIGQIKIMYVRRKLKVMLMIILQQYNLQR